MSAPVQAAERPTWAPSCTFNSHVGGRARPSPCMRSGWWVTIREPTELTLVLLLESLFLGVPQSCHNCPHNISQAWSNVFVCFCISFGHLMCWSVRRAAMLCSCLWIQPVNCKQSLSFQTCRRRKEALKCVPIDNLSKIEHTNPNCQGCYCIHSCPHHTGYLCNQTRSDKYSIERKDLGWLI